MKINTCFLERADNSIGDNMVGMIIRQNKMAKTQAVSSFQWASVLLSLASGESAFDFDNLMNAYNQHPEVVSTGNESAQAGGVGCIMLTGRMRYAVKRWLDATSLAAWNEVLSSTHDVPFGLGPFGD